MSCISPVPYLKWSSSWANFTSTLKFKNSSCTLFCGYSIILQKYQTISGGPSFFVGFLDHLTVANLRKKNAGGFAFCQTKHHWWKSSWYVRPYEKPPGFLETMLIVSTCKNRSQQIIYNLSGPEMEGPEAHRLQHPLRVQGQTKVKLPKTTNYSNLVHPGVAVNLGVARSCPISFGHSTDG